MSVSMTMRMPDEMAQSLGFIAKQLERSRNYLVLKAVEHYIKEQMEDFHEGEFALASEKESNDEYITWDEAEKMAAALRAKDV
jgi:predicted DNA-binding protein